MPDNFMKRWVYISRSNSNRMYLRKYSLVFNWSLCALLFHSCVSLEKIDQAVRDEPPAQSFSSLRISNYSIPDSTETVYSYYSFHQLNKMSLSRKDTLYNWRETIIQLDSLEKGISVSFFLRDTLADQYFLKGKWKNNFFYAKRRIKAKGVPPFYFFYNEKLSVIGKHGSELCLLQSEMKSGMIMLFSAGGEDYFHEHYSVH